MFNKEKALSIRFRENFNNKLSCKYFTSIRPFEDYIGHIGEVFNIVSCNFYLKRAQLISVDRVFLSELPNYIVMLDSGYTKPEFMGIFNEFYPSAVIERTQFALLLFKTVSTEVE